MSSSPRLPSGPKDHQTWGNLAGSGFSYAAGQAITRHKGLSLIITRDSATAEQLLRELQFFTEDSQEILIFPDWETLPYDNFSPHEDIINQRLTVLSRLDQMRQASVIIPVSTLMHRIAPVNFVKTHSLILSIGQKLYTESLSRRLVEQGYRHVSTVYEHGEFAVRGSIIDLYPMGSVDPVRIDLFDDEIDSLRTFDPETQRSLEKLTQLNILPAREFSLSPEQITLFRAAFRENFDTVPRDSQVYQDVSDGIAPAGIEYFLALFHSDLACLIDFLPENSLIISQENLDEAANHFWQEVQNRYENRRYDIRNPILPPTRAFLPTDELFRNINSQPRLTLSSEVLTERPGSINLKLKVPEEHPIDSRSAQPMQRLESYLSSHTGRVLFCAESAGRKQSLLELLSRIRIQPAVFDGWSDFLNSGSRVGITQGPLANGLSFTDPAIDIIAESQLFGQTRIAQRRRRQKNQEFTDNIVKNLTELKIGEPIVHIDHGIGRYQGLETLDIDGEKAEFLKLEYAEGSKLYVPVTNLHLIARYAGSEASHAPISKLGTDRWSTIKKKAAEKVRDTAAELLNIYARRKAQKGTAFDIDSEEYEKFASGFPFEETPDQQDSIQAVLNDLKSPNPTDRLVCGDVGFGKTEVAMRAAFAVANAGKQVAILVPTTLLAQQHYDNFADRFADWPIRIELLSRFRTGSESSNVVKGLASGQVDIVIGTHKLLSENIKYNDLGLLIIDEEHRFGVRQKEALKKFRAQVDMITLTATPIPRTLNMAMASIRDLSIIATPPVRRLSVKTFVRQHEDALVKEAILREVLRGGQVYYLHNEVKDIEKTAEDITALIPEARVAIGHGQMGERQLEKVMSDFYHRRFNVLVCTTIIETGIDVPSANTIIIDRADKFGLAQLHQLRGRVGRSHHQAYAYLLTPSPKQMTNDAKKRLDAIAETQSLGAGFTLATHDLEIRGAGELLGDEQSGHIESIGFSLYMEMLDRAVKSIQSGKQPDLENPVNHGAEINLRIPALIPDDFVPDINTRLILYKRIASCETDTELHELQVELIDRFGLLPDPVKSLFRLTSLRQQMDAIGIEKIDAGPSGGTVHFSRQTTVEPLTLIQLVQSKPNSYKLGRGDQLKFEISTANPNERFDTIENLLHVFSAPSEANRRQ